MTQLIASLQAAAAAVARRPQTVLLHAVVEQLARRLDLPAKQVARHLLAHLQGAGAGVQLYVLAPDGAPHAVPPGTGTRAALRDEVRKALHHRGRGAALLLRRLAELPPERGPLLEALAEWWCEGGARAQSRGADQVALAVEDAVAELGFELARLQAVAMVAASTATAALGESPRPVEDSAKAPLAVDRDQLRKGVPAFDAACIALCRERQRLEGTHRPMQRLVEKYQLSDGHLRKCIRHAEALLGAKAIAAPVSTLFDLGWASPAARRRRSA